MKTWLLVAIVFLGFSHSVNASGDIHDRINACENAGGGSCVFNILRELARSTGLPGEGCGGGLVSVLGGCYGYARLGQSCTSYCGEKGLKGYVDSLSKESCIAAANKIGLSFSDATSGRIGCNVEGTILYFATGVSPDLSHESVRRICECG